MKDYILYYHTFAMKYFYRKFIEENNPCFSFDLYLYTILLFFSPRKILLSISYSLALSFFHLCEMVQLMRLQIILKSVDLTDFMIL